ncbi:MAG: DUF6884 domain-containing protein [Chloroflexota bacterium]
MADPENRFLILSCSQKKVHDSEPLPAIQRYDGPSYRLLRKYLREEISRKANLEICILSAEYGLITSDTLLPYYDRQMTAQRAEELRRQVVPHLTLQVTKRNCREVFINCGKIYLGTLNGFEQAAPAVTKCIYATGSQGGRLAALRRWLYGVESAIGESYHVLKDSANPLFRGMEINFTQEQVLEIGRQALAQEKKGWKDFQAWYVMLDGNPVSPKWLLSQLTGTSVGSFHTSDAKRVLHQLGIDVKPILPGQEVSQEVRNVTND